MCGFSAVKPAKLRTLYMNWDTFSIDGVGVLRLLGNEYMFSLSSGREYPYGYDERL